MIIKSDDSDIQTFLLDALSKCERSGFISCVIEVAWNKLALDSQKFEPLLESAFMYLKSVPSMEVENFFLKYYENIEFGTKKLTSIVDAYFE